MKFIIDDADIAKIKDIYNTFAVDGVTTNPDVYKRQSENNSKRLTMINNNSKVKLQNRIDNRRREDVCTGA